MIGLARSFYWGPRRKRAAEKKAQKAAEKAAEKLARKQRLMFALPDETSDGDAFVFPPEQIYTSLQVATQEIALEARLEAHFDATFDATFLAPQRMDTHQDDTMADALAETLADNLSETIPLVPVAETTRIVVPVFREDPDFFIPEDFPRVFTGEVAETAAEALVEHETENILEGLRLVESPPETILMEEQPIQLGMALTPIPEVVPPEPLSEITDAKQYDTVQNEDLDVLHFEAFPDMTIAGLEAGQIKPSVNYGVNFGAKAKRLGKHAPKIYQPEEAPIVHPVVHPAAPPQPASYDEDFHHHASRRSVKRYWQDPADQSLRSLTAFDEGEAPYSSTRVGGRRITLIDDTAEHPHHELYTLEKLFTQGFDDEAGLTLGVIVMTAMTVLAGMMAILLVAYFFVNGALPELLLSFVLGLVAIIQFQLIPAMRKAS